MLRRSCYDPGPSDGVMGERTAHATRKFQRKMDLPPTGELTGAFFVALKRESASSRTCKFSSCHALSDYSDLANADARYIKNSKRNSINAALANIKRWKSELEDDARWTTSSWAQLAAYLGATADKTLNLITTLATVNPVTGAAFTLSQCGGKTIGKISSAVVNLPSQSRTQNQISRIIRREYTDLHICIYSGLASNRFNIWKYAKLIDDQVDSIRQLSTMPADFQDLKRIQLEQLDKLRHQLKELRQKLAAIDLERAIRADMERLAKQACTNETSKYQIILP